MNTGNVLNLNRIWTLSLVILLAGFIGIGQTNAQTTYYVDGNGPGHDGFNGLQMPVGLHPAGPFATLGAALTAATNGDTIVVLAGDYNANGVQTPTINVSYQVRTSGGNLNVLVDGFAIATAGKTVDLGVETAASGGIFVTNGGVNDLALTAGTINVSGGLTIGAGATMTRTNGSLTGTAPTTTNVNVTYTGALTSAITTGNELPASTGTGTLTFAHTGALVTVPNNTSAATIVSSSAGSFTFSGTATTVTAGANSLNFAAGAVGGTATFSGTVTLAGGFNTATATSKTINMGATSMGNANFVHASTAASTVTLASLDLNGQNLLNSGTATVTVTGVLTLGSAASATRVDNDATMNLGSIVSEVTDTSGNDADVTYTLDNATGDLIISGGIGEYHVQDTGGAVGDILDVTIGIINASGGEIHIGASSTLGGQIANAERDAGADGDGLVLNNSATLTLNAQVGVANLTSIGDVVGGTLVIAYANGAVDGTTGATDITLANNVTFTSAVTANVGTGTLTTGGNLRLQEPSHTWGTTFTVAGTLFIEANGQAITGAAAHSFGGIDVGSTTGSSFIGTAGTIAITGATANLGPTTFVGALTGAAAVVNSTAGGSFAAVTVLSFSASGAGTVTLTTTLNTTGGLTIASGTTVAWTAPGNNLSDIAGAADVNGTLAIAGAGAIGIASMDIDASTGLVSTAEATTWNFDGSGFVGGTYVNGANDTFNFAVLSAGTTISPKPGTIWGVLGFTGVGRTATITESITIAGNVTLAKNVTVALGEHSIVMTGVGAVLDLRDEASITNSNTNGSIQFKGNAQRITVSGTPDVTPSLTNVVVNNGGANPLIIDEPVKIAGTLAMLDGGITLDGSYSISSPYTGTAGPNSGTFPLTFTNTSARIARTMQNEGITLTLGSIAGTYDLVGSGTAGTFGAEYSATLMRNLTVSTTLITTFPATVASISGNFAVTNAAGQATMGAANLTVAGNVTATGDIFIPATFTLAFSGVFTSANNATGGNVLSTGILQFSGASQTHSLGGEIFAVAKFSATGITVNGSIAAGNANGDSEFGAIVSDAASSATLNTIQDVNGSVGVWGTLTINLVSDGAVADTDGQITDLVTVNSGGALTVSSNDAVTTLTAGILVRANGTFTAGSNIGSAVASTIGDASNATAATLDLNGFTFTSPAAVPSMTVVASSAATVPGFGSSGTLNILGAGSILGTTNPTIPNLTLNGGVIDSDVTISGTFTVTAASTGANGKDVTLSGANSVGQFNANYTGTIGAAGSQVITTGTGTTIQTTAAAVTITNLNVNTTSTTTMQRSNAGATVFTVNFLNHDAGVLDITNETLVIAGNSGSGLDWDYDGGSYAGTGTYTMTGAGGFEIDLDTNGNNISIPNLTVNGAANSGLQLGAGGDGITVTGTLTLNGGPTNIETESGVTDASFTMANGSTIIRTTGGATNHWDNAPTLGTGMTVRYTSNTTGVISSAELPSTLARLEWEAVGAASTFQLADNRAITVDYLELSERFSIDEDDDGNNSVTVTDGGTVQYDGDGADFQDTGAGPDESFTAAGAVTLLFNNVTFTTTDDHWPNAVTGSTVTVQVNGSAGGGVADIVTLHENKTAGAVTVGDGTATATNGSGTLATGAFTLTASSLTVNADGIVSGTVNVSGDITSAGTTTGTSITVQGNATLTGGVPGALTLNGTTAQTLTVPAAGFVLGAPITINNGSGVTLTGGNLTTFGAAGLVLTSGVFNVGAATLTITHGGPGAQGFTQTTTSCVYGNVRKTIIGTGVVGSPADRLQFPLCTSTGTQRTSAMTFNSPGSILASAGTALITMRHDQPAADLTGTSGLPTVVNGVNVARYPVGPSFFWTVTPNFTMSPSAQYDIELRGGNYPNFSSSCDTAACDINEIYPIRRHLGSNSNPWVVSSTTVDNFLSSANSPVVIGRNATGALQTSGTVFTYGLTSIFTNVAGATINVTTGFANVVDLSALFSGYSGALTYSAVGSDNTGVTNPTGSNVTGNDLTVIGGADAGAATVTVTATEISFGGTATATFTVNNSAALTASADDLDRTLNVAGTSDQTFAGAFSGGAGAVTYTAASDDASVTAASDGTTVTLTAVSAGSATITLTGTDGSTTPIVVMKTFTVTVNNGVNVAGAIADMSVVQGASTDVDVSGVFADGTGGVTVTVSGGGTTASATIDSGTVTVTGLTAYEGSPLADTAPVTITLTGTDTLSGSATDEFDVTVTPVLGDLDGSGAPSAASASIALDAYLGLVTLTANQTAAGDFNGDNMVTHYDAALIFAAALSAKSEIVANPNADLAFGEIVRTGNVITIPVQVTGDVNEVVSASFSTRIDPEFATIVGITGELGDGWMVKHVVDEDGTINLAIAGIGEMSVDGTIATISIELTRSDVQFNLGAEGAVNDNPTMSIDDVEVAQLPETFALHGNYPNPFNPSTAINFDLPESADVEIHVIDMIGRQVMTLPATTIAAGANRTIQIDASRLASGTYFYRVIAKMESKTLIETGRMMLVK